ncbi:MAG: metalloregulator ArsR/SmtB family transcription factor [Pirellulales bacterium]
MSDALSAKFSALADPNRRAMLSRIARGRVSVSELAKPFLRRMSLPAVTKHLKVLEGAGLITKTQDAQRRLCELNPAGFKETLEYMDLYREMWEQRLDRLGEFLKSSSKDNSSNKGK